MIVEGLRTHAWEGLVYAEREVLAPCKLYYLWENKARGCLTKHDLGLIGLFFTYLLYLLSLKWCHGGPSLWAQVRAESTLIGARLRWASNNTIYCVILVNQFYKYTQWIVARDSDGYDILTHSLLQLHYSFLRTFLDGTGWFIASWHLYYDIYTGLNKTTMITRRYRWPAK